MGFDLSSALHTLSVTLWDPPSVFKVLLFLFSGPTAGTDTNLMNILWMLLHSVYFWSCACTLNALLGLGNLTNCLGGWNLTPECLYHHAVPSPLGNGNDCCKSPQGIHPTLYPNRYWWQLERTTDYDQANCKQYKFQHLAGLWKPTGFSKPY